mmetsp:Transcript_15637/g.36612  ORF Transcript_15637/g.36612 Transcript_15637/m.36612 type:complete len:574 (+) Transcript_15637:95-1816(+)|eukprot:CAMPEP_0178390960 /NCGR_PEP_ID=MMETSP0689_2-20121128/10915_1 /TAXON_ID=160604 /ORGANISM="Amphidinium massartii, Strain CS-259" /LENGTH=573 /DNA_ID=CAMNT_0020011485 /DNA_START=18 /DNA_END=1739 /DNA_ORIENTATION=-
MAATSAVYGLQPAQRATWTPQSHNGSAAAPAPLIRRQMPGGLGSGIVSDVAGQRCQTRLSAYEPGMAKAVYPQNGWHGSVRVAPDAAPGVVAAPVSWAASPAPASAYLSSSVAATTETRRGSPLQLSEAKPRLPGSVSASISLPVSSGSVSVSPKPSIAAPPHPSVSTSSPPDQLAKPAQKVAPSREPAQSSKPRTEAVLSPLPCKRLQKPHKLFPFDLFCGKGADGYLDDFLASELGYVRDHCMVPPFPWGQVIYHDFIVENLLDVPGDFAEFGIGQGGTSLFFARLAKKYGRKFLAVDSFEGLPVPDMEKDNHYFKQGDYKPKDGIDNYENFLQYKEPYDVDDVLVVMKAFFGEVEIPEEFESFAFVHMDSDLYDSVYDSLVKVWDKLSYGGVIAIDDFFHHAQGPARAVADFFRTKADLDEPPLLFVVPTYAVLIIKGRSACIGKRSEEDAEFFDGRRSVMYCPRALDGNFYSFKLMRECAPFVQAAADSAKRAQEAWRDGENSEASEGLRRTARNAEDFLAFLRYPDSASRSGNDIYRYLVPLEDMFDISQGSLVGNRGEERRTIEIGI